MNLIKKILIILFKPSVFKIGLLITFSFVMLSFFQGRINFLNTIEMKYLDFRFQNRGYIKEGGHVAIVAVDEKSIQQIGRWPWSRDVIAKLIYKLKSYGAKVIAFDAFFSEEDPNKVSPIIEKVKKEYLNSVKKKQDKDFLSFMTKEAKRADTDMAFAQAIEEATDNVILGYAFFLDDEEVKDIDKKSFDTHFENIKEAQIKLVFAPDKEERLNDLTTFSRGKGILSNIKLFSSRTVNHAFVNARPDLDGPIRKAFMFISYQHEGSTYYFPSLALKSIMGFLEEEVILRLAYDNEIFNATKVEDISFACLSMEDRSEDDKKSLKSFACPKNPDGTINEEAKIFIPVDEEGRFLINHRGPAKTFPHYSIADIFDDSDTIKASYDSGDKIVKKTEAFKNKIAIFGATAIGVFDLRNTPFSPVFPGVEIHANVIDNILEGDYLTRSDKMWMRV